MAESELRDRLQATLGSAYTLERELGGGGMSRVFAATETALGRPVVIKVLSPELAEGVSVERFKREIQLAAQLRHPHIVPLLAAGESAGLPYYTMPLEDGHSLRMRLAKGGPLPITEAIGVLRDVAKALAYAHEHGVVHRDIKPDNVLLTGGSAVVTDFGVAKALAASRNQQRGATLTAVGSSLGTPAYMAPEQAAADPDTNHRADIYAFGVMAYELLTGQPPFHGRTPQKLLAAQMTEKPEPIGELRGDVPPLLAEVVMKCLEKDPDARPQSAADLVRVLETVTSGGGHPAMPAILLGGRRRLGRALVLYALAFVAVAIVARAAIIAIGLPDWVFPGALVVMALGLPVILFTAFVHHGAHQALTHEALTPGGTPVAPSTFSRLAIKASPWVSWRRTALGGVVAVGVFALLVAGFMTLRALGIGPAGSLLAAGKLKEREPLLVTEFHAPGADSSLGSIVTEAVRTDLGQSTAVLVVPPATVAAALQRMQRPDTSRLDLTLAREVAQREGIKAIVDGDVTPLGGGYVVTVRLVAAESGAELASYRQAISNVQELIPALDKLTRQLRGKIGESLKAVQANPPLEQVTTSSLDALRKYAAGVHANDIESDFPKAIDLLEQAVRLDTTFAMAYRKLGTALGNADLGEERYDAAVAKAYQYRDRLPERERLLATAQYFDGTPGYDADRSAAAYEALLARDSLDDVALTNHAGQLMDRREFERAQSLTMRLFAAHNAGPFEYANLLSVAINQGKLAAADSILAAALVAYPNAIGIRLREVMLQYAHGHQDSVAAMLARMRTNNGDAQLRVRATFLASDVAMLHGNLGESARLAEDGRAQNLARGAPPTPLARETQDAWIDIWFREQPARGVQEMDAALARSQLSTFKPFERPDLGVATIYALAGHPDRARALMAQYQADVKDSAVLRGSELERHTTLGEIALAEKRPLDAVTEFQLADRTPNGDMAGCMVCLAGQLGRAYDLANMPDSAIAAYERYITTPYERRLTWKLDPSLLAGMHKRLGELYEAKGDKERAASHYAKFIDLWKSADPELQPKVAEVRRRLQRLGVAERR